MKGEKISNFKKFLRSLQVEKKETIDDYEERKSGKITELYLEDKMLERMKQLRKEYLDEDIIIGIFTSEFEKRYIGNIEEYAKKLLDDLKKGNESR